MSARRTKWHPPPPPTPRILHLPRRTRKPKTVKTPIRFAGKLFSGYEQERNRRGKLEALFDQERTFSRTVPIVLLNSGESERRERVDPSRKSCRIDGKGEDSEEKWKFQAEILRAECNLLRMEREVAEKKLERDRLEMAKILQAAVETLISGRKRIFEGKNAGILIQTALQKQISDLQEKLEELQINSDFKENELRKCSNFDKQASMLQRRLVKLGGSSEDRRVREIREMAEASLTVRSSCRTECSVSDRSRFTDIEILRRKMESLSKGMVESRRAAKRIEQEYRSMITSTTSTTSNTTTALSPATSTSRRSDVPETAKEQGGTQEKKLCSERCKAIVWKIVEHVQAETEQWSQMQCMLHQVREEMEELRVSRDFWEDLALEEEERVQTLQIAMHEWRQTAQSSEKKISELQKQISELQIEFERSRATPADCSSSDLVASRSPNLARINDLHGSRDTQRDKEKRVLVCRLKENCGKERRGCPLDSVSKRSPLGEIENTSPFPRQGRVVFPLSSCLEEHQGFESL